MSHRSYKKRIDPMPIEKTNPKDEGYVYLGLQNPPSDPHLGGDGTYIVTAMPFDTIGDLLETLRNERNLQIRCFDPQSSGVSPSAFIEAVSPTPNAATNELHVPTEVKTDIDRLLLKQKA
jgi:hypothetical protein